MPEKEIEKEKEVVMEEINSYLDNPAEMIFDDFEEHDLRGQPIGRNILGNSAICKILYTKDIDRISYQRIIIPTRWFFVQSEISLMKRYSGFSGNTLRTVPANKRNNRKPGSIHIQIFFD